jgi:hypothetical protein
VVRVGMVVEYCNCGMVFLPVTWNKVTVVVCVQISMEGRHETAVLRGNSGMVVEYCNCAMVFLQGDCCGVCVDINRWEMGDHCVEGEIVDGS